MSQLKMLKPPKLRKGDVIGVMSPSSPILLDLESQMNRGISVLEGLGFRVRLAKNILKESFHRAGTRDDRLSDFNELLTTLEVKMILFSQGGCVANHLLDGLNYSLIRRNLKIISGISDATTLLNPIASRSGLITFHGPDLIWAFGREMSPKILEHTMNVFCGDRIEPLAPNPFWKQQISDKTTTYRDWKCIRPGRSSGPLVGGHLASLLNIGFSGYGPDYRGKILFLEGTETELGFLDKALNAFRLQGVFKQIAGLVVGWFDHIETKSENQLSVADLILEVTRETSFPILEIGELGHNVENYVFPIGAQATLDSEAKFLTIEESPVE